MTRSRHDVRLLALPLLAALSLGACTTPPPPAMPSGPYVERPVKPAPAPAPQVVAVPYPQPVAGQLKPAPPTRPSDEEIARAKKTRRPVSEVIAEANERARNEPTTDGFVNAAQIYDYMPGALYQLYGAPNHLTMLTFAPGERLLSYAAGDTIRWLVEKTVSGEGATGREHLLVQPVQRDLHTTLIVTTSVGVYQFELKSFQHVHMASVEFRHPRLRIQQLARAASAKQRAQQREQAKRDASLAVPLDQLVEDYRLIVADRDEPPTWLPRRVFHDGARTYVQFAPDTPVRPAIFALDRARKPRLVQSAWKGRYLIIPEVLTHAVLRLGKGTDEQVGIELIKRGRR